MGNICSSVADKSTRAEKRSGSKKRKNKSAVNKKSSKAAVGKKQLEVAPSSHTVNTAKPKGRKQSVESDKTKAVNPLLEDSQAALSSITGSDRRSCPSQIAHKSSDTSNSAVRQPVTSPKPPGKDYEPLSSAKLSLVTGWIDMIEKQGLLDPQDVVGQERKASKSSFRRGSILDSVAKAEIEPDRAAPNGSMRVEQTQSRSSA